MPLSDLLQLATFPMELEKSKLTLQKAKEEQGITPTGKDMLKDMQKSMLALEKMYTASKTFEDYLQKNPEKSKKVFGYVKSFATESEPGRQIMSALTGDPAYKDAKSIQTFINLMQNPYRKDITGAQASFQELAKFIAPIFPSLEQGSMEDAFKTNRTLQYTILKNIEMLKDGFKGAAPNIDYMKQHPKAFKLLKRAQNMQKLGDSFMQTYFGQEVGKYPKINLPKNDQGEDFKDFKERLSK